MKKNLSKRIFERISAAFGPAAFIFWGVVLPIVALVIELTMQMCADALQYDPIPTWAHIVAVAAVPTVLAAWGLAQRHDASSSPAWRLAVGMTVGISIVYAIPFVPILPLAVLAVVVGIGLLALAPLAAAIVGVVALVKMGGESDSRGWWGSAGVAAGLALMTVLAFPSIQLDRALDRVDSGEEAEFLEGLEMMRGLDPELVEERLCEYRETAYPNPLSPFSMFGDSYGTVRTTLFWRVTGDTCKETWWRGARRIAAESEGRAVGFSASRIDASVDTVASTAYTEWLYEVRNKTARQQEADFVVQLPPGAVVSRVTLWVHGEPREATFAPRGKAEAAYQAVVNRSRDPILVTSVAPDRVRVRMFPVPPNETMKARIGISQPLELESDGDARMQFPHVVDGNVEPARDHRVIVEAKHDISTASLVGFDESETDGVHRVEGTVTPERLDGFEVDMERQPASQVYAVDGEQWVVQRAGLTEPDPIEDVILVLDGSRGMAEHVEGLAASFDRLKADSLTLFVAGDVLLNPIVESPLAEAKPAVRDFLDEFDFVGGRDNMPALESALEAAGDDTTIVWIHAAQPESVEGLLVLPERDRDRVWEIQVDGARDVNSDTLHEAGLLEGIPRRRDAASDLGVWFASRSHPTWRTVRHFADVAPQHGKETSRHIARIAAKERVFELMRAGEIDAATELASNYQIVTPVSAAIVLETQAQYDEFGIERASGDGVPSIPEPHEWALIIIGVVALGGAVWRQRKGSARLRMAGA